MVRGFATAMLLALALAAAPAAGSGPRIFTIAGTGGSHGSLRPVGLATETPLTDVGALDLDGGGRLALAGPEAVLSPQGRLEPWSRGGAVGGIAVAWQGRGLVFANLEKVFRLRRPGASAELVAGGPVRSGVALGDGGRAKDAVVQEARMPAVAPDGSVLVPDGERIRRISPDGIITTFAGNGEQGPAGDGGPATAAQLFVPTAVAVAPDGTAYVADTDNHRVRRVAVDGTISTVAGTGSWGASGDGGPAVAADLSYPKGLAVAADGSVVVADQDNHRVRAIAPDGTIRTIAGSGVQGSGGDGGPATDAQLSFPGAVALTTGGALLIADAGNNKIRLVAADGTISTLAGTGAQGDAGDGGPAGAAELNGPNAIAATSAGILVGTRSRVRLIAPDGVISTVAGTGADSGASPDGVPATAVSLYPAGVAALPDGGFLVSSGRLRVVSPDGLIGTLAGGGDPAGFVGDGGPARGAVLSAAGLESEPDGGLLVADRDHARIRRVAPDGTITTIAGTGVPGNLGDGGPALAAQLAAPTDVAMTGDGSILVATERLVRRIAPGGTITTVAGGGHSGPGVDGVPATSAALRPVGIAAMPDGGFVVTTGGVLRRVRPDGRIVTLAGGPRQSDAMFDGDGGPAARATFDTSGGVAADSHGGVYVAAWNGVRYIASARGARLAVAVRGIVWHGRRPAVRVAATRTARAEVALWYGAHRKRSSAGHVHAGVSDLSLPRTSPGLHLLRVTLTAPGGAKATARIGVVTGGVLPVHVAKAALEYRALLGPNARSADSPEGYRTVEGCRRLGAARVDCRIARGEENVEECAARGSVRLGRDLLVRVRVTKCLAGARGVRSIAPRWTGPATVATLV